jgi:para-nitrobenzyl esterase
MDFCRFHRGDTNVRLYYSSSILAAALCALLPVVTAQAGNAPQVETVQGRVEGKMSADGQIRIFLGIPFAAPPVGQLRWKPPQAADKWKGVHPARRFGNRCIQSGSYPDMIFRDPGQSEDCLTLNVWTAAKDAHAKLPVMGWIDGGGATTGGTSEARQDGEILAKKGVVVVSMNYRLGIFGFYADHELAMESPQHAAGNYGLMDQTAAFQWVQRNIAAFGGDPKNVTIFGESAGSSSVSVQMASPLAQGLFARVIGESGSGLRRKETLYPSLEQSEKEDEQFAQAAFGSSSLAALRAKSAEELLKAATSKSPGVPHFGINIDGLFLPQSVAAIYAAGKQAHVPLLAGWNKDEGTNQVVNSPDKLTAEGLRATAETDFGARGEEFLKAYAARNDEEAARAAKDYAGDKFIAYATWAWLEAQTKTGDAPVYRYFFELGSPGDAVHPAALGTFHSDDIEYVFGTLNSRNGAAWRPEDYKLSQLMQAYWTNFAKSGNPNAPGNPNWPIYDAAGQWQVMHLGNDSAAQPDKHRDRYLFLYEMWGH